MSSDQDDREASGQVLDYAAPGTPVRRPSTGTGIVAALAGIGCAFLLLLLYVADPFHNPDGALLGGLLLAAGWALFAFVAPVVAIRRLRSQPIKPSQRRGAVVTLAVSVPSILALIMVIILVFLGARRLGHQMSCQQQLRSVGYAILLYANENANHLPPDLSTLVRQNVIPLEILRCSGAVDPGFTFTADTTDEDLLRAGATDYIYLGAAYQTVPRSYEFPLVIELPGRHGDQMLVLFTDFHQEVLSRQEGAALLAKYLRLLQPEAPADATQP
jgi:multisubunit Na+/H+ antiporter MnhB subunit